MAAEPTLPSAWTACVTHTDCHVLDVGCCDWCGDGELVAVNRLHAADMHRARAETCDEVDCAEQSCPPTPEPSCLQSQCRVRVDRR